jgi:hypothetical protein
MPQGVSYEGVFGSAKMAMVRTQAVSAMPPPPPPAPSRTDRGSTGGFKDEPVGEETASPADEEARTPAMGALPGPALPFTRLTLIWGDDTRLVLEDDGELWRIEPHRRSLRAKLTAAELQTVRAALAATSPEGWSGREAGSRLIVEIAGRQWTVNLPSRAPGVAELIALLEARAR